LFTLTAGLSRPFSGKLTDKIGRIPVMVFGASICFVAGIMYPILNTISGFLFLRFFHGLSTGFKPTGTAAYVADIVPVNHRGEALGLLGVFPSLGVASGAALGSFIADMYSINVMFYTSSVVGILSVLILAGMKETVEHPEKFKIALLKVKKREVYEPRVIPPSIVMVFTVFSFGIILTIIPDFSEYLGIKNKGLFFSYFTIASLFVRLAAGKASDKYGRVVVLKVSTVCLAISMVIIGFVTTPLGLMLAGVIFGLSVGMTVPALFAWTIDLSLDKHRGRAMSTLYIALEIGIGVGAVYSGWIYANNAAMFPITFWTGGLLSMLAFIYLQYILGKSKLRKIN